MLIGIHHHTHWLFLPIQYSVPIDYNSLRATDIASIQPTPPVECSQACRESSSSHHPHLSSLQPHMPLSIPTCTISSRATCNPSVPQRVFVFRAYSSLGCILEAPRCLHPPHPPHSRYTSLVILVCQSPPVALAMSSSLSQRPSIGRVGSCLSRSPRKSLRIVSTSPPSSLEPAIGSWTMTPG